MCLIRNILHIAVIFISYQIKTKSKLTISITKLLKYHKHLQQHMSELPEMLLQ